MFGTRRLPVVTVADFDPTTFVLDVRDDDEWQMGRIDGSAHISMYDIEARVGELPSDRTITVVCRSGHRSAQVTQWLVGEGVDAVNLEGGLVAWAMAGRALRCDGDSEPFVL